MKTTTTQNQTAQSMNAKPRQGASKNPAATAIDIVRRIIGEFTYHPSDIRTAVQEVGHSMTVKLQVNRADMPRVLGKQGTHFRALESLVAAIGAKAGLTLRFQLVEPAVGMPDRYDPFTAKEEWNSANAVQLLSEIADATFMGKTSIRVIDGEDYQSSIELTLTAVEKRAIIDAVAGAAKVLFKAIGRAQGRFLVVDIILPGGNNAGVLEETWSH